MIEKFLKEDQDPKAVERIYQRLADLLTSDEEILYIAVQKLPIVNLFPDGIALTNKRILFFTPTNLGLSIKIEDFVWKDIETPYINEQIIGAVFSVKTTIGSEVSVDYLPKIQARKLYQYAKERTEIEREARRQRELEEKRAESGAVQFDNASRFAAQQPIIPTAPVPAPAPAPIPVREPEPIHIPAPAPVVQEAPETDELMEKLTKLKRLFDKGLISQEEYNNKKNDLLDSF